LKRLNPILMFTHGELIDEYLVRLEIFCLF
jgi:hypothetical protein